MSNNCFLVIIDPTSEHQPALDRAILSAQMQPKPIHLFESVYFHHGDSDQADDSQKKQLVLEKYRAQLSALAQGVSDLGLEVSSEIVWNQKWGEAVISALDHIDVFMVFNSSTIHTGAERAVQTADWTLMRECSCPVLLVHDKNAWDNRRVLAAVNLSADDEGHRQLNDKIIATALSFRESHQSDAHFINALPVSDSKVDVADDDGDLMLLNVWPQQHANQRVGKKKIDLDFVASQCKVEKEKIHLPSGFSDEMILRVAEEIDAALLIIGTVARSGIKGRVIGNTAEKLLDKTRCDILIMNSACNDL